MSSLFQLQYVNNIIFFSAPDPLLQVPFDFCRGIDDVSSYGHEVTGVELGDIVEGPSGGYTAMAFTPQTSITVASNADGSLNTKYGISILMNLYFEVNYEHFWIEVLKCRSLFLGKLWTLLNRSFEVWIQICPLKWFISPEWNILLMIFSVGQNTLPVTLVLQRRITVLSLI